MSLTAALAIPPPSKIRLVGVSKTFLTKHGPVHALEDINLEIDEGEFVCFVGPSGCGKSTLLRIVAGLERNFTGAAEVNGKVITEPGRDRTVMFQEHALFPWLDVLGNVIFGLKLKPDLSSKDRLEVARYYLHLVGLDGFERANIHELSGGMKQRVALARALAPNPRVLLMDEPFASLDAMTREQLYGDLQKIHTARKKTILFVTHNVREAVCLGDRVLLFSPRPGRIRREFKIELARPREFNDVAMAARAAQITGELKTILTTTA
ncbi:MAG: ABC transporter ATP-binding protein [Chthoniobacter sp.]|nr:ABC transporter ATP-binding protein [Chthoniobacter sp.]